jgi:prepilin peptidase CpaA
MGDRFLLNMALLIPLGLVISYYDVRYRRIPNIYVAFALVSGISMNVITNGWLGLRASIIGCGLAFGLMLVLHIFGALGAGDVKLFSAIGAVIGVNLVLPTFVVVVLTGGALAIMTTLRVGSIRETIGRVGYIFYSLLVHWRVPKYVLPTEKKHTIPYGVAITVGSLLSLTIFRALV